jgi:hypothetical protein
MFPGPGNIFLPYSRQFRCGTIQDNTVHYKIILRLAKVDLLQFRQFITSDCTILIPNKNPPTPQGRDVCAIYSTFICRQLGDNTESEFLNYLRIPGIDFKSSSPPVYVAWRAGTIILFVLGSHRLFKNSITAENSPSFSFQRL